MDVMIPNACSSFECLESVATPTDVPLQSATYTRNFAESLSCTTTVTFFPVVLLVVLSSSVPSLKRCEHEE
jgi:hypothetical protein